MKKSIYYSIILLIIISVALPGFCFGQTAKVISMAGGENHSIALKDNGTVWAWGENIQGQLGDGTDTQRLTPVQVIDPSDPTGYLTSIIAISSGGAYGLNVKGHTLALKQDGTVWGWGNGWEGQLGDGEELLRSAPVQVKHLSDPTGYLTNVVDIGAGDVHSIAVKETGTVWAWGNNAYGQLGDGTKTGSLTAVQVTGLSEVVSVAAGENHSIALKQDKTVWAWGNNSYGQLGDSTWTLRTTPSQVVDPTDPSGKLTEVIAVAAGGSFTLALKSDGTVRAWGYNLDGRLGDGTWGSGNWKNTPVKVVDPADPSGYLTGIKAIAAGDGFSMAVKQDGTVWTWGYNGNGQLGDGTLANKNKPVQVTGLSQVLAVDGGTRHSLAAKEDGTLWAWGGNWAGQLGDGTTEQRTTPVNVTFPIAVERTLLSVRGPYFITPGEEVTCLIQYDNIQSQTLEDTVVLFDLPAGFEYVSSTGNGIYRDDRHQVFWKLGSLKPDDFGYLSVKVIVPWGLSAHTQIGLSADLAARNITSSIDVDDYLNYVPVTVISERELTEAEINTLLNSDQKLKNVFDYALNLGYVFSKVAWQVVFDNGSSPWVFVLFDPKEFGLVLITKAGDTAFMEKYQGTLYSLSNGIGGISLDSNDNQLKAWGAWAEAHSQQPADCIFNCISNTVPGWYLWLTGEFKGSNKPCQMCQKLLKDEGSGEFDDDFENCVSCARRYVTVHKNKHPQKYGEAVAECLEGCKDSEKWICTDGHKRERCEPVKTGAGDYVIGVVRYKCEISSSGSLWIRDETISCYPPKVCREDKLIEEYITAECVVPCKTSPFSGGTQSRSSNSSSARIVSQVSEGIFDGDSNTKISNVSRDAILKQGLTSDAPFMPLCEPCLITWLWNLLFGDDPNAKSVDVNGHLIPGQKLTYTIEYENVGEGTAYGVFILDKLDPNLNESTLVINNGGSYSASSRLLGWDIGTLPSKGKGSVSFSVNVKSGVPSGTEITNFADIYFPSVPQITPTNPVVNIVKTIASDPKTIETMSEVATSITLTGRDSGSNPLTYKISATPLYGTISGTPPNITYTSMDEFSGQDEFYYVVNNGLIDSDPARVIVRINPNPADTNPPEVVSTYPKAGTNNVHISSNPISTNPNQYIPTIEASFSEPIDSTTITSSTFTIGGLTGIVAYNEVTRTASFIPSIPLTASTIYTARLTTGIKDKVGNPMASEYSWQFTTESPANIVVTLPDNVQDLNFGNMLINFTSPDKIVSVSNTGTLDLVLGNIDKTGTHIGEFSITDDKCSGKTLTQFENCTLRVAFQPTSTGTKSANLSIPSNDSDTPTLDVLLMGSGMKPQYTLTVNKAGTGGGTVTGTGIDCGTDCSETFDAGTEVTLTGAEVSGSVFAGWSGGGCSGKEPCKVTLNAATTVTATFEIIPYQFVINPSEGTYGTKVTITGSSFGTKPGKVLIGTMALKIEAWANDTISGILLKALAPGSYDVTIKPKEPKGVLPIIEKNFFTVRGAEIDSIEKEEGSAFDQVTVKGKFFGNKSGKVYLEYEAGVSVVRKACKAILWKMDQTSGESEIVFTVPKILPAVCDLVVDPYGVLPEAEQGEGFKVKAPEIISINLTHGSSGNQVTITVKYLGTKPGKVYLGYEVNGKYTKKSCTVLSWPTEQVEVGDIVFVVPTGLSPDLYDVIVTNSVGSDTKEEGFKID